MKVVIDWVPPTLNQTLRRHWSYYHTARKVAGAYLKVFVGRAPDSWNTEGRVQVCVQMYRRHWMDQDGAHGACKPLFDALVELGWARDDSPECMEQIVRAVLVDRKRPRTEIVVMNENTKSRRQS